MPSDPRLKNAMREFRGQKAQLPAGTGYDATPWGEGRHNAVIAQSEKRDLARKGQTVPCHYIRVRCSLGEDEGKSGYPFAPDLVSLDGLVACAQNLGRILGEDVLPMDGEELDVPAFVDEVERLIPRCIGVEIEVTVQNRRAKPDGSHLRDDGTPWQNFWINRALGEDAAGVAAARKSRAPAERHTKAPSVAKRKKAAKKKVARKKKATKRKKR